MFDNESFGRIFGELKPTLQKAGMSLTQIFEMEKKLRKAVEDVEPPKIALIGFTGVGKSSTINALFNADRKSTRLNSSHNVISRMPSSA